MKKSFKITILSGLLLCSFVSIFAQERVVSEQEINSLKDNAYKKLQTKTYRMIMTSEGYVNVNDSSPNQFVKEIVEHISPDRRHSIYERKSGETTFRVETISIGQKRYTRQNKENWKEESASGYGSGGGLSGKVIDNQVMFERKYIGKDIIKNQNADLYVVKTTRKYNEPNYKSTTVITEKFWFDKDGIFLKRESETELNYKKVINHIFWEYEYDPNIKIEAPIVASETPLIMMDPRIKTRNINPNSAPVIAALTTNGEILLNSEKISENKVVAELVKLMEAKSPDQEIVYIKADANADYGNIVKFVKLARKAQIDDFSFMTADDGKEGVSKAVGVMAVLEEFLEGDDSEPGPLLLLVTLENDGKLSFNGKPTTAEILPGKLRQVFRQRKQKRIYRGGSKEVETTVFIKAASSVKYGDVVKVAQILKSSDAFPIGLDIDH